jgi:hypothetical protein
MHSPLYAMICIAGIASLWFLWDRGFRSLYLDLFRERIFEARFALFRLGMDGKIPYDSDLYRQLEVLLCGLLRFGHRATLLSYISLKAHQEQLKNENDYIDISSQIALKISNLEPGIQLEIAHLLSDVRRSILSYLASASLLALAIASVLRVLRMFGIYKPDEAAKISHVVEQEAYQAERKRGLPLDVVTA